MKLYVEYTLYHSMTYTPEWKLYSTTGASAYTDRSAALAMQQYMEYTMGCPSRVAFAGPSLVRVIPITTLRNS